jgi:hypothetical protein
MSEMVQPAGLAVALSCGVYQRQVARALGAEETSFQGRSQCLRVSSADEAAARKRGAVGDQLDSFVGGAELVN